MDEYNIYKNDNLLIRYDNLNDVLNFIHNVNYHGCHIETTTYHPKHNIEDDTIYIIKFLKD